MRSALVDPRVHSQRQAYRSLKVVELARVLAKVPRCVQHGVSTCKTSTRLVTYAGELTRRQASRRFWAPTARLS